MKSVLVWENVRKNGGMEDWKNGFGKNVGFYDF